MSDATASITEMPARERPLSEEYRIVARKWVDADGAASLREELKTTTLEQMKSDLIKSQGEMADNKAERLVKSGPDWEEYIRQMVEARTAANRLKCQMEYVRIKFSEWQAMDATARAEMRLSR